MTELAALERAAALCDLQRWEQATRLLGTVLASDPHNEQGLHLLAQAQYGKGDYEQSLQAALRAISENPDDDWSYRQASRTLSQLGRHQEAQVMARNAVRLAPNEVHGHWILATALAVDGTDLGEARAAADRAVSLAPQYPSCHNAVGMVAAAEARTEDARAAFQRALAIDPENLAAHNELARLAMNNRGYGKVDGLARATGGFATAVRADPGAELIRGNLDVALHTFLAGVTRRIWVVAFIAIWLRILTESGLVWRLPTLLLSFPIFFAARFISRLEPQIRGYLGRQLRTPFIAAAVAAEAIAAAGLVMGSASLSTSSIAFGCSIVFATAANLILGVRSERDFPGGRSKRRDCR